MGRQRLLCVLLCVAAAASSAASADSDDGASTARARQRLPLVLSRRTEVLSEPVFSGRPEEEQEEVGTGGGGSGRRMCGIECQSALPPLDPVQQESALAYETLYENATRTMTRVTLTQVTLSRGFNQTSTSTRGGRTKRQVYGADGRFVISDSRFTTRYPFSAAVRLSTGCSGVLVSPRHVLTAAHCVHDGTDYLAGARRLRVGERNGVVGGDAPARERKGGRGERRMRGANGGGRGGASDGQTPELNRERRSTEPQQRQKPVFRWSRVKQTRVPRGWIRAAETSADANDINSVSADYDYALLELKRRVSQKHMEVGVAPAAAPLARIHFSAYDSDQGAPNDAVGGGGESVVYRFCSVTRESDDLMYQQCDARQGAAGAGVYVRQRAEEEEATGGGRVASAGRRGRFQRRVIGVFSGHRWVELEGGEQRDFNVAVRITPAKYAQICHWIHGDPSLCKEM